MSQHSKNLETVFSRAQEFARQLQHKQVSPNHLLLAMLKTPECQACQVLETLNIPINRIIDYITHTRFINEPYGTPSNTLNSRAKTCLAQATQIAHQTGSSMVRTEHLLIGLLADSALSREVFKPTGVHTDTLIPKIISRYGLQEEMAGPHEGSAPSREFRDLCINLNEMARKGKLDPVIGRQQEIKRTLQILGRRRKNNPVLVGDAGVGKTAIAEGIAQSIVQKTCSPQLHDKQIYIFDIAGLVSNTVFRGQLEGRVKAILDYVREHPNIILFIDEIHLIVGAGNSIGGMDVSNLMKTALSRGEARVIGATTEDEYNKTIGMDSALERRFQTVRVGEPADDDVLSIINGALQTYETHHNVHYTPEAVITAIHLAKRYLPNRRFPDKALDVIDEAGSALKLAPPENIMNLDNRIGELTRQKLVAATEEKFGEAQKLLTEIRRLKAERERMARDQQGPRIVTEDHVRVAISTMSGIPLEKLTAEDKREALLLNENVSRQIIGQRRAIDAVTRYIRRSRTQLNDPKRPFGSLLLLGPTGVGKTLLAKTVAAHLCGSEDGIIQLDMSEYMERHSVSRLIGAPPGYRGYGDQNTLVERVRRNPYAVVLFDEIEKAHSLVWNALLQILEEGRLTDGQGRQANFRNTLVLLTSNIGYDQFKRSSIGFGQDQTSTQEAVMTAVKKEFRPEFLNRIDEIVIFDSLTTEGCRTIIDLEIAKIKLRTKYTAILLSETLQDKLLKDGFSEEYGGRHLKKTVERLITDPISDALLREEILESGEIRLDYRDGEVKVDQLPQEPVIDPTVRLAQEASSCGTA
jgi:ATP-dependent Clp protease ATP-binding subunit ClpC